MLTHLHSAIEPYQTLRKFLGCCRLSPIQSCIKQSDAHSRKPNVQQDEKKEPTNRRTNKRLSLRRPCRFVRPRKTRVTWRSFKERQAVWCWRGAGEERTGSLAVNVWRWGWCSGALPGAPHQSPPVRREPLLTHIAALQQGAPFFLLLIPLHHTTPAYLQHHSRGA